jgi:hypothetical protein
VVGRELFEMPAHALRYMSSETNFLENAVWAKFGIAPLQTARTASEQEEGAAR